MKKIIFFVSIIGVVTSCNMLQSSSHTDTPLYIVEGEFDYNSFCDTTHWSSNMDDTYQPMSNNMEILKMKILDVNFMVYAGTWCGDSKRQVPIFNKILKDTDYPLNTVHYRLLDKSKTDKAGHAQADSIKLVPTFIVYREGKEIGRIVETPKITIEQDLVEIILSE